jgi:hypothetical protein
MKKYKDSDQFFENFLKARKHVMPFKTQLKRISIEKNKRFSISFFITFDTNRILNILINEILLKKKLVHNYIIIDAKKYF